MKKQEIMVSNSFAILSYLRTGRFDNRGKAPIYLRITVNGHRSEFSIKRKIGLKNGILLMVGSRVQAKKYWI